MKKKSHKAALHPMAVPLHTAQVVKPLTSYSIAIALKPSAAVLAPLPPYTLNTTEYVLYRPGGKARQLRTL